VGPIGGNREITVRPSRVGCRHNTSPKSARVTSWLPRVLRVRPAHATLSREDRCASDRAAYSRDRADYGERLLESLSDRLQHVGMSRVEPRELRRYRQFYLVYSRIWESLTPELRRLSSDIGLPVPEIRESATPEFVFAGTTLITSLSFTCLRDCLSDKIFSSQLPIDVTGVFARLLQDGDTNG
jgi:hypothetical protein